MMECAVNKFAELRQLNIPVADDGTELNRLALLKSLQILDSEQEQAFDRITSLVSTTLGVCTVNACAECHLRAVRPRHQLVVSA